MRYYFFELLACPVCKNPNLILYTILEESREVNIDVEKVRCRRWCSLYSRSASEVLIEECRKCTRRDIIEGVIVCNNCGRWYPIINSIPVMLVNKYRNPKEDEVFIKRNID
ncbi:MAG: Trm112 family protein, partial [Acidilobaceae archaeon]